MSTTKLHIENLEKHFPVNKSFVSRLLNSGDQQYIRAVDGVSFDIETGEAFGLAGESGCGKTTTGKTAINLYEPTSGEVRFDGQPISDLSRQENKALRKEAQIIYQDPFESLNPRFTVFEWVIEPLNVHKIGTKQERVERVYQTLYDVGLRPPKAYATLYPGKLSGGERQRVAIARALVADPSFLLADEPASMLDVSIRADILDLLKRLQNERNLTTLYISHDLSLLKHMCDRIGIMYLGRLVEIGPTEEIIHNPRHPYTQALVSSVPIINPSKQSEPPQISGEIPDPIDIPTECRFADRCPEVTEECRESEPSMVSPEHDLDVRCILYNNQQQTYDNQQQT